MVAAVESQSAGGVLHVHLFMYIQMAMQFMSLYQLAQHLREKMLTADALKQYVSHVRRASYPDAEAHQESRSQLEKAWPAFADDQQLSRLPKFFLGRVRLFERGVVAALPIQAATFTRSDESPHSSAGES